MGLKVTRHSFGGTVCTCALCPKSCFNPHLKQQPVLKRMSLGQHIRPAACLVCRRLKHFCWSNVHSFNGSKWITTVPKIDLHKMHCPSKFPVTTLRSAAALFMTTEWCSLTQWTDDKSPSRVGPCKVFGATDRLDGLFRDCPPAASSKNCRDDLPSSNTQDKRVFLVLLKQLVVQKGVIWLSVKGGK